MSKGFSTLKQGSNVPWYAANLAAGHSFEPEVLAAEGAVSLDTMSSILDIDDANDVDFTIANGVEGQFHVIVLRTMADTGGAVVTAENDDTFTFDAADEFAFMAFLGGQWRQIAGTATYAAA